MKRALGDRGGGGQGRGAELPQQARKGLTASRPSLRVLPLPNPGPRGGEGLSWGQLLHCSLPIWSLSLGHSRRGVLRDSSRTEIHIGRWASRRLAATELQLIPGQLHTRDGSFRPPSPGSRGTPSSQPHCPPTPGDMPPRAHALDQSDLAKSPLGPSLPWPRRFKCVCRCVCTCVDVCVCVCCACVIATAALPAPSSSFQLLVARHPLAACAHRLMGCPRS